jgi:hypothetical protein
MTKLSIRLFSLFAAALLMAGCASGPKYSELAAKTPAMKAGEGRIYFYRDASMFGAAVQPDLRLNGRPERTSRRHRRKRRRPPASRSMPGKPST